MTRRRTDLTPEEQANVRRALKFLGKRFGTQATLAKALGVPRSTIRHVAYERKVGVSASMTFRAARPADVSIDALLKSEWPRSETCPHCGHTRMME